MNFSRIVRKTLFSVFIYLFLTPELFMTITAFCWKDKRWRVKKQTSAGIIFVAMSHQRFKNKSLLLSWETQWETEGGRNICWLKRIWLEIKLLTQRKTNVLALALQWSKPGLSGSVTANSCRTIGGTWFIVFFMTEKNHICLGKITRL